MAHGPPDSSWGESAMHNEFSRLVTFSNYTSESGPFPSSLAHAGLYYEGNGDETRCFSCDGRIRNWHDGVDAMEEHLRLYPHCPHVLGQDSRDVAFDPPGNVRMGLPQSTTQQQQQQHRSRTRRPPPPSDTVDPMNAGIRRRGTIGFPMGHDATSDAVRAPGMSGTLRSSSECNSAKELKEHEQNPMLSEDARLQTFATNWPKVIPVEPEDLARAGFYYEGPGDRVNCPFCQNNLQNWVEGDVPNVEHERHFPDCSFVMGMNVGNVPRRTSLDATPQKGGELKNISLRGKAVINTRRL